MVLFYLNFISLINNRTLVAVYHSNEEYGPDVNLLLNLNYL